MNPSKNSRSLGTIDNCGEKTLFKLLPKYIDNINCMNEHPNKCSHQGKKSKERRWKEYIEKKECILSSSVYPTGATAATLGQSVCWFMIFRCKFRVSKFNSKINWRWLDNKSSQKKRKLRKVLEVKFKCFFGPSDGDGFQCCLLYETLINL